MIGNKIEFHYYEKYSSKREPIKKIGLVVDAYTEITGRTSGKSESFLGFGEGNISGSTSSNRMYKVEYFQEYDKEHKNPYYTDIHDWQLIKIISFIKSTTQEINEEKIIN